MSNITSIQYEQALLADFDSMLAPEHDDATNDVLDLLPLTGPYDRDLVSMVSEVATAILGTPISEQELSFDAACYIYGVWDSLLSEVLGSAIWDLPKDCQTAIYKFVYALPTAVQNCYGLNKAEINLIACILGTGTDHEVYLRAQVNHLSENARTILHTLAAKVVSALMTGACKQKSKRLRNARALAIWDFIARRAQDVASLKEFCSFSAQVLGH